MIKTCHDCGVKEGQIHELGCDMERCPFCSHQLLSCDCCYEKLGIDCSEGTYVYNNGLNEQQQIQWEQRLAIKGRVSYIVYPNICVRCGELWPEMFYVSDEEWRKYIQLDQRREMVCLKCYTEIKDLIDSAGDQDGPTSKRTKSKKSS